ncbi:ABC transporter ATP-binding protein [Jiella sp. MQZ9-1]|uniref:ABC transporter ATP-binding protein n=1 Tax=Jiella flava TaxID=2816857 RepID=A0A939G0K2_9HYPH|nr:ABC transporter ATP-binding protein [Jiella flava]MBO0664284.1 ABC transporter ATP-binding protein [Jiella flava]MCD2472793.1 ABC transporter ATP-binding protein [Jiella flava]
MTSASAASLTRADTASEATGAAGLVAQGVSVTFRRGTQVIDALKDVSLNIPRGTRAALIGASGCGKSTLLRVFADIVQPTSGTASHYGLTPAEARANRVYALVQQGSTMLPWRTVIDNVALGLEIAGTSKPERLERAAESLALVGLKGFEKSLPAELSGGMRQRAAIARALTLRPRFLLMDEPFGALDEITRDRLHFELLRILEETGATLFLVTHSIAEAVILSDKVVVMTPRPGRISQVIDVDLGQHRTPATREDPRFGHYELMLRRALHHDA